MRRPIYLNFDSLKSEPAKFHPDPIWKDGALGFLEEFALRDHEEKEKEEQHQQSAAAICDLFLIQEITVDVKTKQNVTM